MSIVAAACQHADAATLPARQERFILVNGVDTDADAVRFDQVSARIAKASRAAP
jgi:hypothetical protein